MKFILAAVFLCMVAVNANNFVTLMSSVDKMLVEGSQIYKEAADRLKHKIDQSFSNRENYIKAAVKTIEDLRKINETCVNAENKQFLSILDIFNTSMQDCRDVAANNSNNILADITPITQPLATDGKELKRLHQNCGKIPILLITIRYFCFNIWKDKANKYLENSLNSIKKTKYVTYERIYYALIAVDSCSYNPFEDSIYDLGRIQKTIENCIAKSKLK